MANWAYTNYVIEGPNETLQRIYDAILHHEVEEGSSDDWEGNVLNTLGLKWNRGDCNKPIDYMRGFIQEDTVDFDDVLIFSAEEAWGATDFNKVLERNFPNIKVYYSVQEDGEEIYATNDKEGKYFKSRYYVDTCIDDIYNSEYFTEEETMYKWLSEITNGRVYDTISVEQFNSDYEDAGADDENYISIHQFSVVD